MSENASTKRRLESRRHRSIPASCCIPGHCGEVHVVDPLRTRRVLHVMFATDSKENSRLIVKGFASYISEERLRAHFSRLGDVTDVRVSRTASGRSREFGFVGYRTPAEAAAAKAFFDQTFLDTRRITVEYALPPRSPALAERKRFHAEVSVDRRQAAATARAGERRPPTLTAAENEHRGAEVHSTSDHAVETAGKTGTLEGVPRDQTRTSQTSLRHAAHATWGQETSESEPRKVHRRPETTPSRGRQAADEGSAVLLADSPDDQALSRTVSQTEPPTSAVSASSASSGAEQVSSRAESMASASKEWKLCRSSRIFIRNLGFNVTFEDLEKLLEPFGELEDVHLVRDRESGQSRGFGFARFKTVTSAQQAMDALDGSVYQGRLLHIMPSEADRYELDQRSSLETEGKRRSFSVERKRQRRREAGTTKDTISWNPFFLGTDGVLETTAERFQMSKARFLGTDALEGGISAAVRLAVAESSLLYEVREALAESGINVQALLDEQTRQRRALDRKQLSRTTIILKNLPARTTSADLGPKLGRYGQLGRLVVAPGGLIAFAEFLDENQAKAAFRGLAYTRYADLPLYLEWAPRGIWADPTPPNGDDIAEASPKAYASVDDSGSGSEEPPPNWSQTSLLIRNLSLDTTSGMLVEHLESLGVRPRIVRIPLDEETPSMDSRSPNIPSKYAFAEFATCKEAWRALHILDGSALRGHRLSAAPSEKHVTSRVAASETAVVPEAGNETKLIVKNIAFEASKRELHQLFSSFGHVKSLRLPKKVDGSGRGFCFVEYATPQETARATALVQGTHFYGRKLVVEYSHL